MGHLYGRGVSVFSIAAIGRLYAIMIVVKRERKRENINEKKGFIYERKGLLFMVD